MNYMLPALISLLPIATLTMDLGLPMDLSQRIPLIRKNTIATKTPETDILQKIILAEATTFQKNYTTLQNNIRDIDRQLTETYDDTKLIRFANERKQKVLDLTDLQHKFNLKIGFVEDPGFLITKPLRMPYKPDQSPLDWLHSLSLSEKKHLARVLLGYTDKETNNIQ